MKKYFKTLSLLGLLVCFQTAIYAGPLDPPGDRDEPEEEPVPIDDYLPYLLAAGALVGAFTLYKSTKAQDKRPRRSEY
ncbi:hypothetical protein [Flavobacterium sp. NKUCC04_CG]|uniref:hypothetical protein n=1 Tax=Flavobacterium sp. NKUCC04_CG TaxID=2842121 RepID=UPI001C5AA015|nr:hypothetical protein [Flavobacterium sp. NKUCC04_CG]MBW3517582.1 hypothetical protein [Flavobacterium sp. NKUCC04_CG]